MADEPKKSPPAQKSSGTGILSLIATVVLAGGAAFGGAKVGAAAHAAPQPAETAATKPGPTIVLEPFLVTIPDPPQTHVLKLTIAVELKLGTKEEEFKVFVPRVRDSTLSYLRSLTFEEAQSSERVEAMRSDLLERIEKLGVRSATQVLVTDYVTQ